MHPQIEALFDEAENRYLNSEELGVINHYVDSLPTRIDAYRTLRDRELEVMQWVADQLQAELPQVPIANLERSIKNALLLLRYCAMGMLLQDHNFVQDRLLNWLMKTVSAYDTAAIDAVLYRLLNQHLAATLSSEHMELLGPFITEAQAVLVQEASEPTSEPASALAH